LCADETAPANGLAGNSAVSIEKVEVGFRGWSKVGEWTPISLTLKSPIDLTQAKVVVDAPDPDDNVASYPSAPLELKAGVLQRCEVCVRLGRTKCDLQIRVEDSAGRQLTVRRISLKSDEGHPYHEALKLDRPLWLTMGNLRIPDADTESAGSASPLIVALDSPAELPETWRAMQSVEMLVLPASPQAGGGTSLLAQLTVLHMEMLKTWVQRGGHLLVSFAADADGFKQSPVQVWVEPVNIDGQFPLRQFSSLESYSAVNAPTRFTGAVQGARLTLVDPQHVMVRDSISSQPLVASIPFGFGRVTLVAVDISAAPLADWAGLKPVLQRIAGTDTGRKVANAKQANRQLSHVGVTDLATQLQQTHEDFSAIERPSYWSVMGLILLYVAVIGPLDYLLVHRILRRPELTWFSFAVLAAGAIGLAAWSAGRINGSSLQVNQFDLIDMDPSSGTTRNTTWASFYSPEHRRYQIAVDPSPSAGSQKSRTAMETGWLASPENSIGGMYRPGVGGFGGRGYRFSVDSAAVDNLPIAIWSTKSLSATWNGELSEPVVDCQLENQGTGQLRGTLTLNYREPLEDCMLVANGWAYLPTTADATLTPGATWQLRGDSRTVLQRDLKALLTGERQAYREKNAGSTMKSSEITTIIEPYQSTGRNRRQQVRILTFFEATGGTEYTGLSNAALRNLDLTDLMKLGRAVLVGRVASSPAQVVVDGQPATPASQSTWVRIVLPVVSKERALEKHIPKASERNLDSNSSSDGKP
jgi:hypothetical protein